MLVVGLGLVAGLLTNVPGLSAAPSPDSKPLAGKGVQSKGRSVTLITGDRVTVRPGRGNRPDRLQAVRGKGRPRVGFVTQQRDGRTYVVPSDVLRLIAAGRLDRRLFDVDELVRSGYDDRRRGTIPLILSHDRGAPRRAGLDVRRDLPAIGGSSVSVAKRDATRVWNRLRDDKGVQRIWLDRRLRPLLDKSVPQVGAPTAWKNGLTGKGILVGVVDTGIDATHPDLKGRVAAAKNFTPSRSGGRPPGPPENLTDDPKGDQVGHGTHVASTIAGRGRTYKGVAPDAKVVDAKVCEQMGCEESAMLAGIQWAAKEKRAKVVNISLGGADEPGEDPVEKAVETLTKQTGTLFVIAAGNSGPDAGTIDSPGSAPSALTVGAVDKRNRIADFSSRGPRLEGGVLKPDITAPGVGIVAARAKGTQMGEPVGKRHVRADGTSMATPHVAGSAAILLQQHKSWKAADVKATLMASARSRKELSAYDQGAGRVDVSRAIAQNVVATPTGLEFGVRRWPHQDDKPVTEKLMYRNLGEKPVKLTLTPELRGPDGKLAPDGAIRLAHKELEIPAGGTASTTVTMNTAHQGPDGAYSGRIVATAGSQTVGTPLAIDKEVESYDVTLKHVDREGRPAKDVDGAVIEHRNDVARFWTSGANGVRKLRLPKGGYHLNAFIVTGSGDRATLTQLAWPKLDVDRDRTLTLDARTAKPTRFGILGVGAPELLMSGYSRSGSGGAVNTTFAGVGWGMKSTFTRHIGPPDAKDRMTSFLQAQTYNKRRQILYGLTPYLSGRFFTGYARTYRMSELAKVVNRNLSQRSGARTFWSIASLEGVQGVTSGLPLRLGSPSKLTAYLTPGSWNGEFMQGPPNPEDPVDGIDEDTLLMSERRYRKGRSTHWWNRQVLAPTLSGQPVPIGRNGDTISTFMWSYADPDGNFGDALARGRTTLFRNGQKIGEVNDYTGARFKVPASDGRYRLVAEQSRSRGPLFSTRVRTAWTFRSAHVPDGGEDDWKPLPAWNLRYAPPVDDHNRVAPGRHRLLIGAESTRGVPLGRLHLPKLAVSYDGGKKWHWIRVGGSGRHWRASVKPPTGAEHVSLRAIAHDSKGNRFEQTVIRAYGIR